LVTQCHFNYRNRPEGRTIEIAKGVPRRYAARKENEMAYTDQTYRGECEGISGYGIIRHRGGNSSYDIVLDDDAIILG